MSTKEVLIALQKEAQGQLDLFIQAQIDAKQTAEFNIKACDDNKLLFESSNGSFHFGTINNTNWNNRGVNSFNIGLNNISSGRNSFVHGILNANTTTGSIFASTTSTLLNSNYSNIFNSNNIINKKTTSCIKIYTIWCIR